MSFVHLPFFHCSDYLTQTYTQQGEFFNDSVVHEQVEL